LRKFCTSLPGLEPGVVTTLLELATEETALLVPVGDVDALGEAFVSLATDLLRRSRLGAAARVRASL
jgi:hypothetical protein